MNFVKFLLSQHFFETDSSVSRELLRRPYKTYYFLKEHDEVFQKVITNLQKMHYFGQFKDHNSWKKKGN